MSAAAVDGRSARAQRTRQIIADAHIALINDGELRPSAKQIAGRAGVSQRALWDNFKDMESLMAGTARQQLDRQDEAFQSLEPGASLPERIERYCQQRAVLLESVAPLARAADLQRPFSPALQENLQENLRRIRAAFEALFSKELAAMEPGDRERVTLAGCTAADWASWHLLRDQLGESVQQAREVLQLTLTALLSRPAGPSPRHPGPPCRPDRWGRQD
ncbi:TetR/AcrR family transcriptional regulator [Arthrobacter sp. H14-L1]|uniref:TetR/AcrR family transcriptional regulator n=1 Tax=Arthrobacter sp. H14-L1 TaxID=2996697 RepID=UPI00226DBFF5|nr:TetR/AcrR family transcriptional regulator [Arthrobacter sp. H14-L1]MCY0903850.1 TetR/AcrR family transcriptional regulator [Arthrobacter sp. H14-L1]